MLRFLCLAFVAFAPDFQGVAGNFESVILRNILAYVFESQMNIEYPLAADTAKMVVLVHLAVVPNVTIVEDPLNDPPIGQLVEIPVDCAEADAGDLSFDLVENPLRCGVTLRTLEDVQNDISLPAESHIN